MSDPIDKSLLDRLQALRGGSATSGSTQPAIISVDLIERKATPTREDALAARLKSLRDQDAPSSPSPVVPAPVKPSPRDEPADEDIDAIFRTDDKTLEELLGDVGLDDAFQPDPDDARVKALLEELADAIPKDDDAPSREEEQAGKDADSDDSDGEAMKRDVDDVIARFRDELELEAALAKDEPPDAENEAQDDAKQQAVVPSTESASDFSLPDLPSTLEDLPAARSARAASTDLDDLTARMAALRAPASDGLDLPDVPTDAPSKPVKRLTSRTNYTDDDVDSWCTVCLEDATLRCLGCEDDVYCARCWREMHVGPRAGYEELSHKAVQFTRDRKKEKRKIAMGA
ncbi:hypothetical protein AK830_g7138 [Neonectria ditissima]|uniref:Uncharacterized protein n=1 Tax=Neonectria ditissima TaxID=78410 RepID=A0A0P7BFT5_9HYPO|nr:hypothetical protein AK830_g7138 [Neonectria ditissima]